MKSHKEKIDLVISSEQLKPKTWLFKGREHGFPDNRLGFVGDFINRGPQSVEVLKFDQIFMSGWFSGSGFGKS